MGLALGQQRVLCVVLAGGEGKRLMPLTADRAKPAVPFGGVYRLIDFPLSNLVNSGLRQIIVLTQYKSQSLDRHISLTWQLPSVFNDFVATVPAQQRVGKRWYLGSADAIFQNLNLLHDSRPDIVVVVGADHVYRMDFSQMVAQHIESGAAVSVAAIRQPIGQSDQFGVIEVDPEDPRRITAFREKPKKTPGLPDSPSEILASMGNYVFDADALIDAVTRDARDASSGHDMGGDVIPALVERGEAAAYDFRDNVVPGAMERDRGYWRDVGTIDSFYDAHRDLISVLPIFNLYNGDWPIYPPRTISPPAKFVEDAQGNDGRAIDSIVSNGALISGGLVTGSMLFTDTRVMSRALVSDSVVMDNTVVGQNATVRRAILDKNVVIGDDVAIGVDRKRDLDRGLTVTASGITVVGKGTRLLS